MSTQITHTILGAITLTHTAKGQWSSSVIIITILGGGAVSGGGGAFFEFVLFSQGKQQ